MSILSVVKTSSNEDIDTKVNKPKGVNKDLSLNHLNQNTSYSFDFGKNNNPEMAFGRLKTERGITGIIFSTLFTVLIIIGLIAGLVFAFFKFTDYTFVLFEEKSYYSLQYFNSELGKLLLLLFALLFLICIICVFIINFAVKIRFRKSYLSKTNVYIYDIFIGILNALVFSLIAYCFFVVINNYHAVFTEWLGKKMIDPEVNFTILSIYKYLIVIVAAVFVALNSLRGIAITHEKNKFVFENHL